MNLRLKAYLVDVNLIHHNRRFNMILAVVGSRDFSNKELVLSYLKEMQSALDNLSFVSGGAKGVDSWCKEFADTNSLICEEILPDWKTHGKAAGMIRNTEIIDKCDVCLAFWNGKSKGTLNSIQKALKQNKLTFVVSEDGKVEKHAVVLQLAERQGRES